MVSFIVIGRNVEVTLLRCLESVVNVISECKILEFEILYVDSNSSDKSLSIAVRHPQTKVFQIKGKYNAALARNVGFEKSNGKWLVFVDADMELKPAFFSMHYYNSSFDNEYFSGEILNIYNSDDTLNRSEELYYGNNTTVRSDRTGGIFIIKRQLWILVGGMTTKYRRSQDIDFGLKLANKGIFLTRYNDIICNHYTISYYSKKRLLADFRNGNQIYLKSVILRDHFLYLIRSGSLSREGSLFILVASVIGAITLANVKVIVLYLTAVLIKTIFFSKGNKLRIAPKYLFLILLDIVALFGVIFFWPRNLSTNDYKVIEINRTTN